MLLCDKPLSQPAITNLSFADAPRKPRSDIASALVAEQSSSTEPDEPEMAKLQSQLLASSSLSQPIADLLQLLEQIAERGCRRLNDSHRQKLRSQQKQFEPMGIQGLTQAIANLLSTAANQQSRKTAESLIRLHYITQLCQQSLIQIVVQN